MFNHIHHPIVKYFEKNNIMNTDDYFKRLFDASNSPCLILLPDAPNYTIKYANKAYLNAIKLTKEEFVGQSIIGYLSANTIGVNSDHVINLQNNLNKVIEFKRYSKLLAHSINQVEGIKEPVSRYWDVEDNPVLNDNNEVELIIHELRDVTEREELLIKLQQSHERNEYVAKATSEVIWEWELATGKIVWNDNFTKIFGFTNEQMEQGHSFWVQQTHPDDRQRLKESFAKAKETGSDFWKDNYRIKNGDGNYTTIEEHAYILRDNEGKVYRVIGAIRDISEKEHAEKRLVELNADLQKQADAMANSNKELEQFAYIASHDLQEPLRMITGFLHQLQSKYSDSIDERGQMFINYAVDGATRMKQLTADLLEYSRVGRLENKKEEFEVKESILEIETLLRRRIEEQNATINFDSPAKIYSLRTPFRQLMQNLISNSLKYAKKGVPPVININVKEEIGHWVFSVQDNGIGIKKEFYNKIFIIFQRLHARHEIAGTGLGLAISKKIVENLGGKIWVDSEPEKGSTFSFTIAKD